MITQALSFKTVRDLFLINILSALLVVAIAFFPDSPVRIILGLPFILFFPGYVLICALFPGKKDLGIVERLALSLGLSIAVTPLIGLALNYMPFGIRPYPAISSLFSFTLLVSIVAMYRRRIITPEDTFAPLASISIVGWRELTKNEFMKLNNGNITLKLTAIIAFIFITLALAIIAKTPPASGYEISIYAAYPWYFWFSIISAIFLGMLIQTKYIFSQKESNFWYIGLFVVVFTTIIILLLPIFRDYYTIGRGDLLTHLGYIKGIIDTSHAHVDLFYPIIHILGTCIVYVTNIPLGKLPPLLSTLFYMLYVGSFYLLGSGISRNRHHRALITMFATTLFYMSFTILIFPAFQSIALIPLILYLYHKSRGANTKNVSFAICTIIVLFAIIYFHPITALYLIVILLVFCIFNPFYTIIPPYIREKIQEDRKITGKSINLTAIAIIIFFFWYISYSAIVQSFRKVTMWLVEGGETKTVVEYSVEAVIETGPTIYEFVKAFVNNYGAIFMLLLLCVFCIIYWLKTVLSRKEKTHSSYIEWVYVMILVVSFSIVFFEMFAYVVEFNPVRNIRLLILVSSILTGLLFYNLIERHITAQGQSKKLGSLFLVFIVLMSSLCILNVYPSPKALMYNTQVTEMEVSRFNWFADHFDNDIQVVSSYSNKLHRFSYMLYPGHRLGFKTIKLPQHFGYDKYESVAEVYDFKEVYILYNIIELRYPYKYSKDVPYNEDDVSKLCLDSAVAKIYSNGELTVWKTEVKGGKSNGL
jgi:hypothetical protein